MNALMAAKLPWISFALNLAFAAAHGGLGLWLKSWWYVNLMVYYVLLAVMRFGILHMGGDDSAHFIRRFTAVMLMILPVCLTGTVILCTVRDRGVRHHEIVMITIALYAFTKVTMAIINLIRASRAFSAAALCLRNISLVEALVSICSLQRSMLVSFGGMAANDIVLFNVLTGTGVSTIVFLLGLNLWGGKRVTMAKSKIVEANEKIAEGVVKGYKAIEKGVVDGYKKVEQGVVSGFTKIEDKFVERYLTRDGETVEEARERLNAENSEQK